MPAPTDYDAPRTIAEDCPDELDARRSTLKPATYEIDKPSYASGYDPPGAEIPDEELTIPVLPKQAYEFHCGRCFLVRHKSQHDQPNSNVCKECAETVMPGWRRANASTAQPRETAQREYS